MALCKDTHTLVGFALHFFLPNFKIPFLLLLLLIFLFSLSLLLLLNASNTPHISCVPQSGRAGAFRGLSKVDWGKWGPSALRWTISVPFLAQESCCSSSRFWGILGHLSRVPCKSLPAFLSFAAFLLASHTFHTWCGKGTTQLLGPHRAATGKTLILGDGWWK